MQRYEQESRSEHAGDFDGGREGSKHLTLVPLYRFIGLSVYRFVCSATPTAVSSVEVCVSALARLGWLAHEPLAQRHTTMGPLLSSLWVEPQFSASL